MRRTLMALCAVGLLAAATQARSEGFRGLGGTTPLATASAAVSVHVTPVPRRCRARTAPVLCAIHFHRHRANRYRHRMGLAAIPYHWIADRPSTSPARRGRILAYWVHVQHHAARRLNHWLRTGGTVPEPYRSNLMCIHSNEGSMVAYNPAGPYYGGWQMDSAFMRHWGADMLAKYGGRDARYWSPHDQLVVAYRAARKIGYSPWPQTAAMCGL